MSDFEEFKEKIADRMSYILTHQSDVEQKVMDQLRDSRSRLAGAEELARNAADLKARTVADQRISEATAAIEFYREKVKEVRIKTDPVYIQEGKVLSEDAKDLKSKKCKAAAGQIIKLMEKIEGIGRDLIADLNEIDEVAVGWDDCICAVPGLKDGHIPYKSYGVPRLLEQILSIDQYRNAHSADHKFEEAVIHWTLPTKAKKDS